MNVYMCGYIYQVLKYQTYLEYLLHIVDQMNYVVYEFYFSSIQILFRLQMLHCSYVLRNLSLL